MPPAALERGRKARVDPARRRGQVGVEAEASQRALEAQKRGSDKGRAGRRRRRRRDQRARPHRPRRARRRGPRARSGWGREDVASLHRALLHALQAAEEELREGRATAAATGKHERLRAESRVRKASERANLVGDAGVRHVAKGGQEESSVKMPEVCSASSSSRRPKMSLVAPALTVIPSCCGARWPAKASVEDAFAKVAFVTARRSTQEMAPGRASSGSPAAEARLRSARRRTAEKTKLNHPGSAPLAKRVARSTRRRPSRQPQRARGRARNSGF